MVATRRKDAADASLLHMYDQLLLKTRDPESLARQAREAKTEAGSDPIESLLEKLDDIIVEVQNCIERARNEELLF